MMDIRKWGFASILSVLLLAGPARAAPEVGWWWNPDESGRGYTLEVQGDKLFVVAFMYDDAGHAV